jgi:unsaturated rhamnogalacturonyl hydrolase
VKVQDETSGLYQRICPTEQAIISKHLHLRCLFMRKGRSRGYLYRITPLSAICGYHGLLQNLIKADLHGLLTLEGTCGGAGLGGEPYRDGSFDYYASEKIIPNDPKGVSPFILAALEMESAGIHVRAG